VFVNIIMLLHTYIDNGGIYMKSKRKKVT